jgi:hypothetical protein
MTTTADARVRLLCFGDSAGAVCGAVLDAGDAGLLVHAPAGDAAATGREGARIQVRGEAWQVRSDGIELDVLPLATPTPGALAADELCQVTGQVRVDGTMQTISCLGTRSQDPDPAAGAAASLRAVAGWFPERRAVSLRAVRPAGSAGHESDHVTATVFDPEAWIPVTDPRLSTTFKADQGPERTSLEMWVGDEDELYPRRAAGEATGPPLAVSDGQLKMTLTPLQCHSSGQDGSGVYVLALL